MLLRAAIQAKMARTLETAQAAGVALPMAEVVRASLQAAESLGLAAEDWSVALRKVARTRRATSAT